MNQNLFVNKTTFHLKGFTLGLALKQRPKTTQNSPIALADRFTFSSPYKHSWNTCRCFWWFSKICMLSTCILIKCVSEYFVSLRCLHFLLSGCLLHGHISLYHSHCALFPWSDTRRSWKWHQSLFHPTGNLKKIYMWVSQSCAEHTSGTKVRVSISGGPHAPVNMANSMEVNVGGKKMQEMACLLCCIALYFVHRVFKTLGLPSPLWIQKQSNYWHCPHYLPCLQEHVACQRS